MLSQVCRLAAAFLALACRECARFFLMSKSPIQPLPRRRSVGAVIAAELQQLIESGVYKPGDCLPGQRQLAGEFGASMAGVREAISVLSAAGLVETQPGKGTVVRGSGSAGTFDGWLGAVHSAQELADLIEVRRALEALSIRRVAQRASPDDLSELKRALDDLERQLDDPSGYTQADMQFHLTLARLSDNRIMVTLMQNIQRPLAEQLRRSIGQLLERGELAANFATHQRIYQGIAQGDVPAALAGFDDMLRGAMQNLQGLDASPDGAGR